MSKNIKFSILAENGQDQQYFRKPTVYIKFELCYLKGFYWFMRNLWKDVRCRYHLKQRSPKKTNAITFLNIHSSSLIFEAKVFDANTFLNLSLLRVTFHIQHFGKRPSELLNMTKHNLSIEVS